MNKEILRLLNNLLRFDSESDKSISFEILKSEFEAFAEDESIVTIKDLNETIETEISYMMEDSDND